MDDKLSIMTRVIRNIFVYTRKLESLMIKNENLRIIDMVSILCSNPSKSYIIFDVGAHNGESITKFSSRIKNCVFHCFEPSKKNYSVLEENFKKKENITLNNVGIGSCIQERIFHEYGKTDNSSYLKLNLHNTRVKAKMRSFQNSIDRYSKSHISSVITLDSYCEARKIKGIDILKIDTQGFDSEVLTGAEKLITEENIGLIIVEIIISDQYEKSASFKQIEDQLFNGGYKLIGLELQGRTSVIDDKGFFVDALYGSPEYHRLATYIQLS